MNYELYLFCLVWLAQQCCTHPSLDRELLGAPHVDVDCCHILFHHLCHSQGTLGVRCTLRGGGGGGVAGGGGGGGGGRGDFCHYSR